MLRKYHPIYINTHFNHPWECTTEAKRACEMIADAGIPLGNQAVLMKGVNDDPDVMLELMRKLLFMRVRPYYLYQADITKGANHFRTPVSVGLDIMDKLRGHTSGLAIPQFVIDAPGGGGKIPLLPQYVLGGTATRSSCATISTISTPTRTSRRIRKSRPRPWSAGSRGRRNVRRLRMRRMRQRCRGSKEEGRRKKERDRKGSLLFSRLVPPHCFAFDSYLHSFFPFFASSFCLLSCCLPPKHSVDSNMRIPDSVIDDIRNASDIVDVIGAVVRLKKRGKNFIGLCPFHQEKSPSFTVSAEKQMFHCFGCGVGGNVFSFVMEHDKLSFIEAVRALAEKAGIRIPEQGGDDRTDSSEQERILAVCRLAGLRFHDHLMTGTEGRLALEYFRHRGLTDATIAAFGLGYSLNSWDDLLLLCPAGRVRRGPPREGRPGRSA